MEDYKQNVTRSEALKFGSKVAKTLTESQIERGRQSNHEVIRTICEREKVRREVEKHVQR